MKTTDMKLLWGRSGNKCAICRENLTKEKTNGDKYINGTY